MSVLPETSLSAADARRIALRAQGLRGAGFRRGGVPALLRRLGAVQLDTISVLARSHELVAYARLGAVGRERVERAYWGTAGGRAVAFEYWSHAACVLPVEAWPSYAFRRRARRAKGRRWHQVPEGMCEQVLARLRADGPLTATELGGAKGSGSWWSWTGQKIAIEWLLDIGEVVCVRRTGWRRVYDLPERVLPADVLARTDDEITDEECLTGLVAQAGRTLGVATRADLADYPRLTGAQVDSVVGGTGLVPVEVEGWNAPAWADPEALKDTARARHRTTLLSPFDSLVWDRKRTERMFGFTHRLEAYTPAPDRVHGYFAMPLLAGGRLRGRVDPAREGRTLVAKRVSLDGPAVVPAAAEALREAASWVGCDAVRVEHVTPAGLAGPLASAVA
ncbi:MAG TPA: crosslink repair DNA glycosylase YcaQ family protein [Streptosporangiaceae bacterium]